MGEIHHSASVPPYASTLPRAEADLLDTETAAFAARFGLDGQLATAYGSAALPLHFTGIPGVDADFAATSITARRDTLQTFSTYCEQVLDRPLWVADQGSNREVRRNLPRMARQGLDGADWDEERVRVVTQYLEARVTEGIFATGPMNSLFLVGILNYYPEARPEWGDEDVEPINPAQIGDLTNLFAGEDLVGATRHQLLLRMREAGLVDLSEATLNARFTNFVDVMQVELSTMFLNDLMALLQGQRATRLAENLMQKYSAGLVQNDIRQKQRMLQDMADGFETRVQNQTISAARRTFRLTATGLREVLQSIDRCYDFFSRAYQNLGYPLPDLLRKPQTVTAVLGAAAVAAPVTEITTSPASPGLSAAEQEALITDVATQSTLLQQRLDAWWAPWRQSEAQRKRRGFDAMRAAMMTGTRDALGAQVLRPTDRATAQELIDILARCDVLARMANLAAAQTVLHDSVSAQRELESQLDFLRAYAHEADPPGEYLRVAYPAMLHLDRHLEALRRDWKGFRGLIIDTWPDDRRAEVAIRIERLLLEPPAATLPEPAAATVETLRGVTARQLDAILLPPEPTVRDVELELSRISAERTTLTRIEWQRLLDLVALREQFGGVLYRSRKGTLGNAPPYFVVEFVLDGATYAVAESPVFGNATFVVSERHSPGTWLEVLELYRRDVVKLGGHTIRHSHKAPHGPEHVQKVLNKIIELRLMEG